MYAIILPSHYEGFGFPYQEAKIFSKRMLVYDMPVSREFCDENLTTFVSNYKGQLSHEMSKIIENKYDNNIKIEDNGYNYNNRYFEKLEAFLKRAEREN